MNATEHALLALSALILTGLALPGSTWHVDVNGTPPGDGSPGNAYTSIQFAIDQATTVDGDTILVAPGTYVETVFYRGKLIRVASTAGPERTVITPNPGDVPKAVVIDGTNYSDPPQLEGFTVSNQGPFVLGQIGIQCGDAQGPKDTVGLAHGCIVRGFDLGFDVGYTGEIEQCTVTECRWGVTSRFGGQIVLRDSIVKGNVDRDVFTAYHVYPAWLSHSNFDPSFVFAGSGIGNIDAAPRFWDAANGDFRLLLDSPCIDTGDPASPPDPDGSRVDMGAWPYDHAHAPGTDRFCLGTAADCPCANGGGDGGCGIAQGTGGVELSVLNFAPDGAGGGAVELLSTGYPPNGRPGVTLVRSPAAASPPVVFGDGLRCVASAGLVTIGAGLASGGTSLQHVNHGAGAGTFFYQVWVRNNPSAFCTPAAFNLSNGVSITWP